MVTLTEMCGSMKRNGLFADGIDDGQAFELCRDACGQLFGRTGGVFDVQQCFDVYCVLRKWGRMV
jgi:hypothetical protein